MKNTLFVVIGNQLENYIDKRNLMYERFLDKLEEDICSHEIFLFTIREDTKFEDSLKFRNSLNSNFCDGFIDNKLGLSAINDDKLFCEEKLKLFQSDYNKKIKLFKLNGSDNYFTIHPIDDSGVYSTESELLAKLDFKTREVYMNKSNQLVTNNNIMGCKIFKLDSNANACSKFKEKMSDFLKSSEDDINKLYIIGYSFDVDYINTIIRKFLEVKTNRILYFEYVKNTNCDILDRFKSQIDYY